MFNLSKDINAFQGVPPYAMELYGVYQPLLGWQSNLTRKWIQRAGARFDPRVKRVLDANLAPVPTDVSYQPAGAGGGFTIPERYNAVPLTPAPFKKDFRVILARDLNSQFLVAALPVVKAHVDAHDGALPAGAEWQALLPPERIDALLKEANVAHMELFKKTFGASDPTTKDERVSAAVLEAMRYESQIAGLIAAHVNGQSGLAADSLAGLFVVIAHPQLSEILKAPDPLANIDPRSTGGALSPVGFVHLFRQYFFDLGTFLGEPVEHIWLAPGTTVELVEISTRKLLVERTMEELTQTTQRGERETALRDELSDSIKATNESSTKLGVSQTNTVNLYVYQGTVSADFGLQTTRTAARETVHKQNREQTEKISSELKQSFKSIFRTVSESSDTTSRRHVISNPDQKLVNYELRRKMRRIGVQVQDIGLRMCWQVFVDDPGAMLGLAELVDLIDTPDLDNLREPEKIAAPTPIVEKVVVPIPFLPILDYSNNNAQYEFAYIDPPGTRYEGKYLSKIMGVDDEDDRDDQTIIGPFRYTKSAPQTNYELIDIRLVSVQGNKIADILDKKVLNKASGEYEIVMRRVHYGGENVINLEMELVFAPTAAEFERIVKANASAQDKYDAEKQRLLRKAYLEAVRKRIKDANSIASRPSWDLREEERTVVYRKLIERLMLDSWKLPDSDQNRRLSHVRSEAVRSIFDVDAMLYFVAPEWWMPRRRRGRLDLGIKEMDQSFSLSQDDLVKWGGEKRPDNYKITEDSSPAPLGSSLGWLIQLDGDNLRNAFLNAPWVKAVIPIRPGRELAALNWLRDGVEQHENDGWNAPYVGTETEFADKTVGQALEIIAERLEAQNSDIKQALAADKVFEHGFDHLASGFDAGVDPQEVFSQWISVLPTDQIVAVNYEPTSLQV